MALRSLLKHRGFTLFATLSLALGIGANTALFGLVDALLLRTLAVRAPERLVTVETVFAGLGIKKAIGGASPAALEALRARREVFSEVVGYDIVSRPVVTVDGGDEPNRRVERTSPTFFADLGLTTALGRTPRPNEEAVAVIGDA